MPARLYQTSVGKKVVMAVTGLALFGFVIGHLLGNLLIFLGPEALNAYAEKLEHLGAGLWVARILLLTALIAHIITAILLTLENRAARPIPYVKQRSIETTYAAKTMMISGILVFVYIVYHLLHFTVRVTDPEIARIMETDHNVYAMVVHGFQQPAVSGVYIAAIALLCIHLSHGISSLFQSLGLQNEKWIPVTKNIGRLVALLIFIGYSSIPAAVLLGFVTYNGGTA